MSEKIVKLGVLNAATNALSVFLQTSAGKSLKLTIGQVFSLRYELAQKDEEFLSGNHPEFSDINTLIETLAVTPQAPPAAPPKEPEASNAKVPEAALPAQPAEPAKPETPAQPAASAGEKPATAAKPEKGIKVALTVELVKKDNTAFRGSDGFWYAITKDTKVNAKVDRNAKVTVYYNQGKKDRFVNSIYPARS